MFDDELMLEINSKLSGIILRKAELEQNFDNVYSLVFERMFDIEEIEGDEFLSILGDIGG